MDTNVYKEVDFYKYCPTCQYKETAEGEEPCNECLTNPSNVNSHKPVNYKEKE